MKKFILALLIILNITPVYTGENPGDIFNIYYVDRYPYHYKENGEIKGVIAAPVDYAFKKSGYRYKWQEMPAIRQMVLIKENKTRVAMVGWFKNDERSKFAKFSIPIYQDKSNAIVFKKDNPGFKNIHSFRELISDKNLVLLVKEGYSYGKENDLAIVKYNTRTFKTTVDNVGMVKMIDAGRCDYMFATQEEADFLVQSAGIDRRTMTIKSFPDSPSGEYRYILFSKIVGDSEIARINGFLKEYLTAP